MYKKTVLDSGITVVTESHRYQRSVAVGAFIKTGTRDENKALMGISHFVEHMVFKGTKNRTAGEISRSIEAVGGDLNAYTTREYTCFHATSLKEDLALDIDVLGDLVCHSQFAPKDFDMEKKVILQEVAMTEDNPEEYLYDTFFERVYKNDSLGWPILGTEETLKRLKRTELKQYYRERYTGKNIIIAAAGCLEHDEVVELVEKHFRLPKKRKGRLPPRKRPKWAPVRDVINKPGEQVHVLAGFEGVSFTDKRRFDAFVLNSWLGGGMSSKLYQSIREKRGLAYTVYSSLTTFTDCGALNIYAGTDGKSIEDVLLAIDRDIKEMKKKRLNPKALELFKQQVRGNILLGSEDMENRMTSLGVNEMTFNHYMPVDEVVRGVEEVKIQGVREITHELLDARKLSILIMGDVDPHKVKQIISRVHGEFR